MRQDPYDLELSHWNNSKPPHTTKNGKILNHQCIGQGKDITRMSDNCPVNLDGEMLPLHHGI